MTSQVGNFAHPETPELEDFGDMLLRSPTATGYIRVDWFTPDGLGVWGDGRLTILGTDGYIELRKYIDIAGRPGGDHLFLVDRKGIRARRLLAGPSCPTAAQLRDDVLNRTETAMPQAHCFLATELALKAQAGAAWIQGPRQWRQRLRVAVVGGGIGAQHIEAYRKLPELYEVRAFCDIDAAKAQA